MGKGTRHPRVNYLKIDAPEDMIPPLLKDYGIIGKSNYIGLSL